MLRRKLESKMRLRPRSTRKKKKWKEKKEEKKLTYGLYRNRFGETDETIIITYLEDPVLLI
jgi:hypothetical protein